MSQHTRPSQVERSYLVDLNAEQRRAVEHGCGEVGQSLTLLIIAGAGSGKTNTLDAARIGTGDDKMRDAVRFEDFLELGLINSRPVILNRNLHSTIPVMLVQAPDLMGKHPRLALLAAIASRPIRLLIRITILRARSPTSAAPGLSFQRAIAKIAPGAVRCFARRGLSGDVP
jgi:hypothetical protein